jgi:Rod binding domain-containing protein
MTTLFQTMRKTVTPSGLFGNDSLARGTYEYLLDQSISEHAMASGKGLGLAEKLAASWEKTISGKD